MTAKIVPFSRMPCAYEVGLIHVNRTGVGGNRWVSVKVYRMPCAGDWIDTVERFRDAAAAVASAKDLVMGQLNHGLVGTA